MNLPPTYDRVREIVEQGFELTEFVFGPNTDIISIADQLADPEVAEDVVSAIQREFAMRGPMLEDGRGRERRAVLRLPATLTVAELASLAEAGRWPEAWSTGDIYRPLFGDA